MENTKKTYSPAEAAVKVLERVQELYKSSNLNKSNTAHEIEAGPEPHTQNAECPEPLAEGPNIKGAKKKHNEAGNEEIEGGDAEGMEGDEFDNEDLEVGTEVEGEHTDDEEVAGEIAEDHLEDEEDYYEEGGEAAGEDMAEDIDEAKEKKEGEGEEDDDESDKDSDELVDDVVASEDKEKKEKKPFEKSECVEKACEVSNKLNKFMKQRAVKKAKTYEVRSKKKVKSSDNAQAPSKNSQMDREKYKEEIQANRNPSKDMERRQYRKKNPKKAVVVDKDRGNKKIRRKKANRKVEKMLGVKDQAKEAYKKPEIPKPPKLNEGY